MKYPPPTPAELQRARELILRFRPHIENFRDDLRELTFQAMHGNDEYFEKAVLRMVAKIDAFMAMEETQFLNKEDRDVTSHQSGKAKRSDAHVVPSKREEQRRQSGGGHKPHPAFGEEIDFEDIF